MQFRHGAVVDPAVADGVVLARRHALVDPVEALGHGDDHRGHRQRIEECGEEGRRGTEQQGKQALGPDPQQDAAEDEKQHVPQEPDACHDEDQQQDHRKVVLRFPVHGIRGGEAR